MVLSATGGQTSLLISLKYQEIVLVGKPKKIHDLSILVIGLHEDTWYKCLKLLKCLGSITEEKMFTEIPFAIYYQNYTPVQGLVSKMINGQNAGSNLCLLLNFCSASHPLRACTFW